MIDKIREPRAGLPCIAQIAAWWWHALAGLKNMAHGGARFIAEIIRVGREW